MKEFAVLSLALLSFLYRKELFRGGQVKPYEARAVIAHLKERYPYLQTIPTGLVMGIIDTESDFDPRAVGSAGEIGLMQVKPSTAQWVRSLYPGVEADSGAISDQILNGMLFLKWLQERQDLSYAGIIESYNVGYAGYKAGRRNKEYLARVLERQVRWTFPA